MNVIIKIVWLQIEERMKGKPYRQRGKPPSGIGVTAIREAAAKFTKV